MDPICALSLSLMCRATAPRPICNPRQPEQSALMNCKQPVINEEYDQKQRIYNRPQYCERFRKESKEQRNRREFTKLNCPLG